MKHIIYVILGLSLCLIAGCGLTSKDTAKLDANDPKNFTIYAATDYGLSIGKRGGEEWENIHSDRKKGLIGNNLTGVLIQNKLILTVCPEGINVSTSDAKQWSSHSISALVSANVAYTITAIDESYYLATDTGIYISTNNISWRYLKGSPKNVTALQGNASALFALNGKSLYVSTDNAKVWNKTDAVKNTIINSISVRYPYCAVATNKGIMVSTDNAITFMTIDESKGLPKNETDSVFIDSNGYFYAGNSIGFCISKDKGSSWNKFDKADQLNAEKINDIYVKNNYFYLATNNGVYVSYANGTEWKNFTKNNGLKSNTVKKIFAL